MVIRKKHRWRGRTNFGSSTLYQSEAYYTTQKESIADICLKPNGKHCQNVKPAYTHYEGGHLKTRVIGNQ